MGGSQGTTAVPSGGTTQPRAQEAGRPQIPGYWQPWQGYQAQSSWQQPQWQGGQPQQPQQPQPTPQPQLGGTGGPPQYQPPPQQQQPAPQPQGQQATMPGPPQPQQQQPAPPATLSPEQVAQLNRWQPSGGTMNPMWNQPMFGGQSMADRYHQQLLQQYQNNPTGWDQFVQSQRRMGPLA